MTNKTIANLLIGSYGVTAVTGLIDIGEFGLSILGLAMLASSVIATVRLYKLEDPK